MNLPELGEQPADLAEAARRFLREKFLRVKTGVSGANFLIAETGGVGVVESEGNGRMCLTLPETLITIAGIDKVIPRYQDLEVLLQLLPRSATGERMNPYNSIWTGVHPGDGAVRFTSFCWITSALKFLPIRRRARRCSAFVAVRVRTRARCIARRVAMRTAACMRALSGRF